VSTAEERHISALLDAITQVGTEAEALTIARGCTLRELQRLCDLLYLDEIGRRETLALRIVREARA